jgi:hypothetical protein
MSVSFSNQNIQPREINNAIAKFHDEHETGLCKHARIETNTENSPKKSLRRLSQETGMSN